MTLSAPLDRVEAPAGRQGAVLANDQPRAAGHVHHARPVDVHAAVARAAVAPSPTTRPPLAFKVPAVDVQQTLAVPL